MSTGTRLGSFVLRERMGASVWLAEDTGSEKAVAVKVLTRQLPGDAEERETLIREVRSGAALYHTFLVPVIEVVEAGDSLLLVMERVEADPLSRRLKGTPATPADCFRLSYQLASVLKYLQSRQILHGNINSDSAMVTAEGMLILGGLNLANLMRRGKPVNAHQQKRADLRSVAYMAPEQITSGDADARSDIFSLGAVLYEAATGCLPFAGRSAAEIALAITQRAPISPLAINPALPPALLAIVGRCLFKDPERRFQEPKEILEAIDQAEPEAAAFARGFERSGPVTPQENEPARPVLLVAELNDYERLVAEDLDGAARASARMQLFLGETVHLFDGHVIDPLGVRFVAELPSVESAIEAGRKAEFDAQSSDSGLPALRMLLHAGEFDIERGEPVGPAIEKAFRTLAELPQNQLFISEEFVREGRGRVRLRDAGARGGMKLYTIVPAEPPTVAETEVTDEASESEAAPVLSAEGRRPMWRRKGSKEFMIAAAAMIILVVGVAGGMRLWRTSGDSAPSGPAAAAIVPAERVVPLTRQSVYVAPFTVESDDPALVERASSIRLAAIAILRGERGVRLVDSETDDAVVVTAGVRSGEAGTEIVTRRGETAAEPRPLPDAASGVAAIIEAAAGAVGPEQQPVAARDVVNAFADATIARANGDRRRTEASLRKAISADPSFLPAQLLAMEFFAAAGRDADAIAAARQVLALDPANLDATRRVARASLISGDMRQGFSLFAVVLERNPRDAEALNHFARYALSVGDEARFRAALRRMQPLTPIDVAAHEPDLLAAAGRIDAAMQGYYALEDTHAANAPLALKIGRFAVLRHSLPIAELQLAKLEQLDPLYGYHLLSAYIAAEKQQRAAAVRHLESALSAATPGDDSWTAAAEVYTILADTPKTLESLERAAQRKEPTSSYVLSNPLFRYLANEPRFGRLRERLRDQQAEIRAALDNVP